MTDNQTHTIDQSIKQPRTGSIAGAQAAEFAQRLDTWCQEYRPQTSTEMLLVRRAVILSWKLERAEQQEIDLEAQRACERHDSGSEAGTVVGFDASPEAERLRRYQFALERSLMRVVDKLAKMTKGPTKTERTRPADATRGTSIEVSSPTPVVTRSQAGADVSPIPATPRHAPAPAPASAPAKNETGPVDPKPCSAFGSKRAREQARRVDTRAEQRRRFWERAASVDDRFDPPYTVLQGVSLGKSPTGG